LGNAGRRFRRANDTISPYASTVEVANIRAQHASRVTPWTIAELENTTQPTTAATTTATTQSTSTSTAAAKNTSGAKTSNTAATKKPAAKTTTKKTSYNDVHQLLQKNTCLTCHTPTAKLIGPSYSEIAKKKYSVAQIVQLIQKPNPSNWPGYATKMPPMAHVPKGELTKIAEWIKSLEKAK
jgi:cytochrome c551/c552